MLRNLSPRRVRGLQAPLLSPLWSAAFSFSKCHAVRKVPYDPNLLYLFDGEEYTQMAKFWTHGYDIYSPDKVLVMHDDQYVMRDAPSNKPPKAGKPPVDKEWAANGQSPEYKRTMFDEAAIRVRTLLDLEGGMQADAETIASLQQYGLGSKRTLDQLQEFTGVNHRQGMLFDDACKARRWVPFVPDSHAELIDGDPWGMGAEVVTAGSRDIPILKDSTIKLYSRAATEEADVVIESEVVEAEDSGTDAPLRANPLREYPALWGLFLPIESLVESAIATLDGHNGLQREHAVRNVKLLLLILPVILLLVVVAARVVSGKAVSSIVGGSGDVSNDYDYRDDDDYAKRI